ncbi:MAG: DNA mismatch repair protein MutS [Thermoanaerobaculia bacterium]
METDPIEAVYEERRRRFGARADDLERRSRRLGNLRLAVFVLAVLAFLTPVFGASERLGWTLAAVLLTVFVALVAVHRRVDRRRDRARDRQRLNDEALSRLARDWDGVPEPRLTVADPPSFARDLDVFGHASLWKLLGTVATPLGKATLARWLLEPAEPAEIRDRQAAVRQLAPLLDVRQELQRLVRSMDELSPDCEPFLRWAEGAPWLARRRWLKGCARALPVLLWTLLGLATAGILPHHLWLFVALFNLVFSARSAGQVHAIFHRISAREREFLGYSRALELLIDEASLTAGAPRLRELRQALAAGSGAPRQMRRLHRLVALADVRHSSLLHAPVQALTMWDFHVLDRLEGWQREAGRSARAWLEALAEIEALSALAGLSFDQPDWCFPEVLAEDCQAGELRFEAEELGHPLLAAGVRVCNDVTVGPPGTFLLLTGSNMSGKSTLIRALGSNAVLAQAGGPVCARRLVLPSLELGTSVLIEDSLEDGVSFFMAELRRVKEIVDLAAASRRRGRTLFYLMDEILRGTNTFERQAAVRKVLIHLLRAGALGAVATHDLMLAEIDGLAPACRPMHFRETLGGDGEPAMSFDYRLRPGVATTRNALKLLELVGLIQESARNADNDDRYP